MSGKKLAANCPNCGAPIKSLPTYGHSQWCEYCGSLVDMRPYMPKPSMPNNVRRSPAETRVEKHIVYVPAKPSKPSQISKSNHWIKKDDDGHVPPEEWWKIGVVILAVLALFLWAVSALP